ncbi:hypothetical protein BDZ89DRAFT_75744 [Hymenopellis radicata]|nr:hypothetical protein BDZ89DRAFT_75744 [Hymenopellis radicata]
MKAFGHFYGRDEDYYGLSLLGGFGNFVASCYKRMEGSTPVMAIPSSGQTRISCPRSTESCSLSSSSFSAPWKVQTWSPLKGIALATVVSEEDEGEAREEVRSRKCASLQEAGSPSSAEPRYRRRRLLNSMLHFLSTLYVLTLY